MPLVPAVDDSGVWRSCLAVLLPYMRKGEELVMQLVKDCNTNYCCLKLRCCPWRGTLATLKMLHWSPSPRHKILLSMTGCSLHYISLLKNEIVSSTCTDGLNCHLHTSCHVVSSISHSLSSKLRGNYCLSTPRVCCADGETIGRGQFPHRHEDPSWIQMMCDIDPIPID